jgi:hypothetical protein
MAPVDVCASNRRDACVFTYQPDKCVAYSLPHVEVPWYFNERLRKETE